MTEHLPRILIAEDDDNHRIALKLMLKLSKYDAIEARDGQEAIARTLSEKPDLILMDIKMPIMNGLDATVIIRKKDKELPIIMQTAYAFTADREKALECGVSEVLVKPITLSALRTCLSRYLPKLVW